MSDQNSLRYEQTLRDLVELRNPVPEAASAVGRLGWDSEAELVVLTPADAVRLLRYYLDGRLSADDCRLWAETIEGRDDIGFAPRWEDLLKEFIFEIATPEISQPLTPAAAGRWLRRLGRSTE